MFKPDNERNIIPNVIVVRHGPKVGGIGLYTTKVDGPDGRRYPVVGDYFPGHEQAIAATRERLQTVGLEEIMKTTTGERIPRTTVPISHGLPDLKQPLLPETITVFLEHRRNFMEHLLCGVFGRQFTVSCMDTYKQNHEWMIRARNNSQALKKAQKQVNP